MIFEAVSHEYVKLNKSLCLHEPSYCRSRIDFIGGKKKSKPHRAELREPQCVLCFCILPSTMQPCSSDDWFISYRCTASIPMNSNLRGKFSSWVTLHSSSCCLEESKISEQCLMALTVLLFLAASPSQPLQIVKSHIHNQWLKNKFCTRRPVLPLCFIFERPLWNVGYADESVSGICWSWEIDVWLGYCLQAPVAFCSSCNFLCIYCIKYLKTKHNFITAREKCCVLSKNEKWARARAGGRSIGMFCCFLWEEVKAKGRFSSCFLWQKIILDCLQNRGIWVSNRYHRSTKMYADLHACWMCMSWL